MNKDVIAYIELLKDIHTKTELVTERLFSMEYQMFAGTRSEIKHASDVDKLLALNHFLRMTIKEFYNTFMQPKFKTKKNTPECVFYCQHLLISGAWMCIKIRWLFYRYIIWCCLKWNIIRHFLSTFLF